MPQNGSFPPLSAGEAKAGSGADLSLGPDAPAVLQDLVLLEKLAQFERDQLPERVVHAKGAGAFGSFELTHGMGRHTCADFLQEPGQKTDVFARFSSLSGERGDSDAERDIRGFALKFYTRQGNYDLVGSNSPVFFIRDPIRFPELVHAQKRRRLDNLRSEELKWDFWSQAPECLHQLMFLFSGRGIPASYRHMHGYGCHAFMWYNDRNEHFWVKYHVKTEQGARGLSDEDAWKLKGQDPDHATRDLYEAIARKEYPAWTIYVQIMTPEQTRAFPYDPFDPTKVWPHDLVPLKPLGRLVLDSMPESYFQDVEQAAFNPSSFVPGIAPSPDKMLQGRLFSCHEAQVHRLGSGYYSIGVNQTKGLHITELQNARLRPGAAVLFAGVKALSARPPALPHGEPAQRHSSGVMPVDYEQPAAFYGKVLDEEGRQALLDNVASSLNRAARNIRIRSLIMFWKMNKTFARRLAREVDIDVEDVETMAKLSFTELIRMTSQASPGTEAAKRA